MTMTNNTNQIPCDFPGVDINLLQSSASTLSIDKSNTNSNSSNRVVTPPTVEKTPIKVDTETRRVSWNCPDTTNDINPLDVSFEEFQKERRRRTTAGLISSTTSRRRVSTTDIMADWNENDEVVESSTMNKERKESIKRQREIANKVRKDFNILRKRISDMEDRSKQSV